MNALLAVLLAFLTALLPAATLSTPIAPRLPSVIGANDGAQAMAGQVHAREASVDRVTGEATRQPISLDASAVTHEGTLSYVSPSFGSRYLALPEKVGTRARICGPADCVTRISTDYGPDQRVNPDRIADLSAADFVRVCGVPLSFGLCPGTVTLVGLPATDSGGNQ